MADYSNPKASNAILGDLQEIVALINSGAKLDPTGNTNIPNGAKRVVSVTGGYQIQSYNGSTWVSVGKLMHDCDSVDGKSPNTGTAAGTIPVRDNKGQLPGDITGNAGTATKLATARTIDLGGIVSATEQEFDGSKPITIPVNSVNVNNDNDDAVVGVLTPAHGGTGRTDGAAADVVVSGPAGETTASEQGQVGNNAYMQNKDLNTLTTSGHYISVNGSTGNHYPYSSSGVWQMDVHRYGTAILQKLSNYQSTWTRSSTDTGATWTKWTPSGLRTSALTVFISKSGNDKNTGLVSSEPVLTIARAIEIATGYAVANASNIVKFCVGEGNWGNISFRSLPFALYLYPFDNTAALEYSASLPVFGTVNVYDMYVECDGIVANTVVSSLKGVVYANSYNRFANFSANRGSISIVNTSSAPVDIISVDNHKNVFNPYYDGTVLLQGNNPINVIENLTLADGFISASNGTFLTYTSNIISVADGVSVTGKKYNLVGSNKIYPGKSFLDSLPGSQAGTLGINTWLNGCPWGGGDEHTYLAADCTWKKDSDAIYARDVYVDGALSLTESGLFGKAKYITDSTAFNIDTEDFDLVLIYPKDDKGTFPPGANDFLYIRQWFYGRTIVAPGNRMQIAHGYSDSKLYSRVCRDGVWTDWDRFVSSGQLSTATLQQSGGPVIVKDVAIQGDTSDLAGTRGQIGDLVMSCTDLNDALTSGVYAVASDALNSPRAGVGILFARRRGSGSRYCLQTLYSLNTAGVRVYNRFITNADTNSPTFYAWSSEATEADLASASTNISVTGDFKFSYRSSVTGWLLCNGAAVSRTTYADLYAVIGTKFGTGDGSTTFNLPDMRGKVAWGANGNLGSVLAAGLPGLIGQINIGALLNLASGVFNRTDVAVNRAGTDRTDSSTLHFDASRSNSIYGNSTTVQPPAIALNCFIKY